MEPKATRSSNTSVSLLDYEYKSVETYVRKSKLPSGAYVLGRMIELCKPAKKGQKQLNKAAASSIVANEVIGDWVSKNVYPKSERAVSKQIKDEYDDLMKLVRYSKSNKAEKYDWRDKAVRFNLSMTQHALDIRTKDLAMQKKLEDQYGVKMTESDGNFFEDNCHGSYTYTCSNSVPKAWSKKTKKEESRSLSADNKRKKLEGEIAESSRRRIDFSDTDSDGEFDDDRDENFMTVFEQKLNDPTPPPQTRSDSNTSTAPHGDTGNFPKVKVRSGRGSLSERLVRCIVQCMLSYKVSYGDLAGIMVMTANVVFGQTWSVNTSPTSCEETESEDDSNDNDEANQRKHRSSADLTYVFPSRRCVSMYMEDAYVLNLQYVAQILINKDEDTVVTVSLDDTTKAAGHRLYDIKADHVTVNNSGEKTVLTTGFIENKSHSGEDGAKAYEHKLADSDVKDQLYSAVLNEVHEALRHQLSSMPYFNDILGLPSDESLLPDMEKLAKAPLTNLGCEAEMAWFDNRVRFSGGSESVHAISRKLVISTNGLLVSSNFEKLDESAKKSQWNLSRTSEESRKAKKQKKTS